jgi:hypothetical protein
VLLGLRLSRHFHVLLGNGCIQRSSPRAGARRRSLPLLRRVACHVHRVPGLLPFPGPDLLTLTATAAASIQDGPQRAHEPAPASAGDGPFSCIAGRRTRCCRVRFSRVAHRLEDGPGTDSAPAVVYESARHMTSPSASSSNPMPGYCCSSSGNSDREPSVLRGNAGYTTRVPRRCNISRSRLYFKQ